MLASYAQILFSRSLLCGFLLLLATAAAPRAMIAGLLAVVTASLLCWLLDLEPDARREGAYGYNALLLGLGVAQTFDGVAAIGVLVVAVVPACVVLTAALRARLLPGGLPVLSWPFLILFSMLLCAPALAGGLLPLAAGHGAAAGPVAGLAVALGSVLPAPVDLFLRALGALFFLPQAFTGGLLLLALLWHSRVAALLATTGFALAWVLSQHALSLPAGGLIGTLGYNAAFVSMALGGVWLVPSASAFAVALLGVLLCAVVTAGTTAPLARLGLLVMVLPFNIVTTLLLLTLRLRAHDRRPKAVDFMPGTPEENLAYFRTRLLRFRWLYPVRMRLPFRGAWVCTQGVDGRFTHQERWRHAYDFEVRGADGLLFRGDGSTPQDYHAYRLPVLAAAAGTVVKVINHVPDNAIGAMNLEDNWGNLVLVYHAPGLYSLVAHLQQGSVKVYEGQPIGRGDVLGLCGNSGRSPQPHLHFHLQGGPRLGDPTLPCRFNDVVLLRKDVLIDTAADPRPGDEARNLEVDETAVPLLLPGIDGWRMRGADGDEHIVAEVDLLGRRLLRSRERGAVLYYDLSDDFFMIYDVVGDRRSVLHLLRAALPRVPLELNETLRWHDHLPARPFRALPARVAGDFVSPFLQRDGIEVELRLRRDGRRLIVTGESLRRDRAGVPVVQTRAVLVAGAGPLEVELTVRGRRLLASVPQDPPEQNPAAQSPAAQNTATQNTVPQTHKETA